MKQSLITRVRADYIVRFSDLISIEANDAYSHAPVHLYQIFNPFYFNSEIVNCFFNFKYHINSLPLE